VEPFLDVFAKLQKVTASLHVCLLVRPHATSLLPLDGFSLNLTFDDFFENVLRKYRFD
jgi:hypothetical protein